MLLYLVRHGETHWNLERRIQGSTDIPLNDTGRGQATATGKLLAQRHWDAIITSPLSRAVETGQLIAREIGFGEPIQNAAIAERHYGEAEGMAIAELAERFPGDAHVPGRETREQVVARALPALIRIAERHPGGSVIVVSHGGVIRSILGAVDPDTEHPAISNGSVHSFRHVDGSFELLAFNDPIDDESLALAATPFEEQNPIEQRENAAPGAA
ncbi:MAG: histidine phosphatase family protein [Salinibacterium sp.]|nr:histidine phosphatase family protein [Salinibacterium sp.]